MPIPSEFTTSGGGERTIKKWMRQYGDNLAAEADDPTSAWTSELPNPLYAMRFDSTHQETAAMCGARIKRFDTWNRTTGVSPPYSGATWESGPHAAMDIERVWPDQWLEWNKYATRYFYFRVLKIVHEWSYSQYSLETTAGSENAYFNIGIMPHQGDRAWTYTSQFADMYGWRSMAHAGAKIYTLKPGGRIRYSCKPAWQHTRSDGTTHICPDNHWMRTDVVADVTRRMYTITWCAWSSIKRNTLDNKVEYWGTCQWPSTVDRIFYRRWAVVQFASEGDEVAVRD